MKQLVAEPFDAKKPELLWSPTVGLLLRERGHWIRIIHANGARPIGAEVVDELPADRQEVLIGLAYQVVAGMRFYDPTPI